MNAHSKGSSMSVCVAYVVRSMVSECVYLESQPDAHMT